MKKSNSTEGKAYRKLHEIRTPPPEQKPKQLNLLTCKNPFEAIQQKYNEIAKRRAEQ